MAARRSRRGKTDSLSTLRSGPCNKGRMKKVSPAPPDVLKSMFITARNYFSPAGSGSGRAHGNRHALLTEALGSRSVRFPQAIARALTVAFEARISEHIWSSHELCARLPETASALKASPKRIDKGPILQALAEVKRTGKMFGWLSSRQS
jgi:hypothetical protein